MKKILKALILICFVLITSLTTTGCSVRKFSDRLVYLESTADSIDIYYDKETKVMYMEDAKGTMTPMVDSEGNILLKE